MPTLEEALLTEQSTLTSVQSVEEKDREQIALIQQETIEAQAAIDTLQAGIDHNNEAISNLQVLIAELEQQELTLEESIALLTAEIESLNSMVIPNSSTPRAMKKGEAGLCRVWSLQRALNSVGYFLLEDGLFQDATDGVVRDWQGHVGLTVDGIFGPASSEALALQLDWLESGITPLGLTRGIIEAESSNWIAEVNWSVPGGVDCGYTQRRVYAPDYSNQDAIRRAFDSKYQINLLADRLRGRHDAYLYRPAVEGDHQYAWRLAALYHNWQYGADLLSKVHQQDLSSYWTTVQPPGAWPTNIGAHFPNGELVDTPLKWAKFYALGAPNRNWPGATTKYVTAWTP